MVQNFKITFVITAICLVFAALWGLLHGVNADLFMMGKTIIATIAIAIIEVIILSKFLSINFNFIEALKNKKVLILFIISALTINTIVFTNIISYSTGMGFIKTIYSIFSNPNIYLYQVSVNKNLISMYCGSYLMIVAIKYFINTIKIKCENPINSRGLYLFISLLLIIGVVSRIPDFYKYKVLISGFWAILSYFFVEIFIRSFKIPSDYHFSQQGIYGFILALMSLISLGLVSSVGTLSLSSDLFVVLMGLIIGTVVTLSLTKNLTKLQDLHHNSSYLVGVYSLASFISAVCLLRVIGWDIPQFLIAIIIIVIAFFTLFKIKKSI